MPRTRRILRWDWPTVALIVGVTVGWLLALLLPADWGGLAFAMLVLVLTMHSSLSHELLHGHPFGVAWAETMIGLWQPSLLVPYLRFKRTHLAHHMDANLTDPYDDPESNYFDPAVWEALAPWTRAVLRVNNTLAGRIVIGPIVGMYGFIRSDILAIRGGDRLVAFDWLAHIPGVVLTLWAVTLSDLGFGPYFAACYVATSILKIRTFLEHQAHDRVSGRTAIVEDRGPLAFLFLNNSLHVVHHMHPNEPWYRLWPLYRAQRARYVTRNGGYVLSSYGEVMRRYLWRSKDPVPHPLWRGDAE